MRSLILTILISLLLPGNGYAECTNCNTASASCTASSTVAQIQACVGTLTAGGTINIGAGSATWATPINISTKDLNLIGAGIGNTVITCTGDCVTLARNGTSSASRISGFTFINGVIYLWGLDSTKAFRIDHNRFQSTSNREMAIAGGTYGVHPKGLIDNNTVQHVRFIVAGTYDMLADSTSQFAIWATDPDFGGPNAIYIENNTLSGNSNIGTVDANYGGRYVYRFNTVDCNGSYCQEFHGVQGGNRAGQRWETYGNTFSNVAWTTSFIRGGSGYYFNNKVTNGSFPPNLKVERSCEVKAPFGLCDGIHAIDGNASGGYGYACRDQIGRSKDSSMWGGRGVSESPAWPLQASTPAYSWSNTATSGQYGFVNYWNAPSCSVDVTYHDLENRDYYNYSSATGSPQTVGVRVGTLANRPAGCTAGVGYWATDQGNWNRSGSGGQGVLYKCTSTNTWTAYYIPYTYPHPLQGGSSGGDRIYMRTLHRISGNGMAVHGARFIRSLRQAWRNEGCQGAFSWHQKLEIDKKSEKVSVQTGENLTLKLCKGFESLPQTGLLPLKTSEKV
jgi:hypothetical protein